MKTRKLVVFGLFVVPAALSAQQRVPLPRGGKDILPPPTLGPQTLPPQAPVVARALAVYQSRWSVEGYSMISAIQVPSTTGSGTSSSATYGLGTHAGYRYTDHLSATVDLTASPFGGSASTQTVELGTRYAPFPFDMKLRPYFDLRAAYLRMNDQFAAIDGSSSPGSSLLQFDENGGRYSRGIGGVGGIGFEYSLTRSFALTNEVSLLRDRMTTYKVTGLPTVEANGAYWMTSFRYAIGLKYSAVRALHLAQ